MDPVFEIKARLPIEELVASYCQLKKKGRGFVALCPFHNDTRPSMTVSPDKGIAYCFACNSGGDIFSFYQKIENVDFRQALIDLAERTGVKLETTIPVERTDKDEKERARACLVAAAAFYQKQFTACTKATEYLAQRGIEQAIIDTFQIGYAPDSFSDTYQHLLKEGFSRNEILLAGLGVQKDLAEGKIYDRFRNRIMFPILDQRGDIVGFGGRTIGEDDAKYINSSEGPLYNKSTVLYGLSYARDAIRESKKVILVEGYFDVIACHRVGVQNVVAASGTALTQQHVKILKRYADTVILSLDQDRAGQDASQRAFCLCKAEGMNVTTITLPHKDPDETACAEPVVLQKLLQDGGVSYFDSVLQELQALDLSSAQGKHEGMQRVLPLLQAMTSSVEREHEMQRAAMALGTTPVAFQEDLERFENAVQVPSSPPVQDSSVHEEQKSSPFSCVEITLGLFLLYPAQRAYLKEMIEPEEEFASALFTALQNAPETEQITVDILDLPEELRERAAILQMFCEHHGFTDWSESVAQREIRHNVQQANRELVRKKQRAISRQLLQAGKEGKTAETEQLMMQYQQVLKLAKMTSIS
ncbi:MAG: DNA primase [Candidatus Peribacteraceae bacterium]|jgi:DNA primase